MSRTFQRTLGETNYGLKGEDGKAVDFLDNVFMKVCLLPCCMTLPGQDDLSDERTLHAHRQSLHWM